MRISPVLLEKIQKESPGILNNFGLVKSISGEVVQAYGKSELGRMLPLMAQLMLKDEMDKASAEMQLGEIKKIQIDNQDYDLVKTNKGPAIIKRVILKK